MLKSFNASLAISAVLFFVTSLVWSRNVPLFEAPDEYSHYLVASFIGEHSRLPTQAEMSQEHQLWEGFQPPLYYLILAGFIKTGLVKTGIKVVVNPDFRQSQDAIGNANYDENAMSLANPPAVLRGAYDLRLVNVMLGTLLFVSVCLLFRVNSESRWGTQLGAIWCFVPAVVFSTATMTNDVLAALCCSTALLSYYNYRARDSRKALIVSTFCFGLGMLTKSTVLFLWAAIIVVEVLRRPVLRPTIDRLLLVSVPLLIGGAGVIRSLTLHPTVPPDPVRLSWMNSGLLFYVLSWPLMLVRNLYASITTAIGVLGAQALWLPGWIYGVYLGFFAVVVFFAFSTRSRGNGNLQDSRPSSELVLACGLAATLLIIASVIKFRESGEPMHARLLMGYIPGILLGFASLSREVCADKEQFLRRVTRSLGIALVITSLAFILIFENMVTVAVAFVQKTFMFQKGLDYYLGLSERALIAGAVIGLFMFFALPLYKWLSNRASNVSTRLLLFSSAGFAFNVALLFLYVLPGLRP